MSGRTPILTFLSHPVNMGGQLRPWLLVTFSEFNIKAFCDRISVIKSNFRAVFVTAQPLKISLHNFYEFVWLLKTGIPRMLRILAGNEAFIHDSRILSEGYQHYSPWVDLSNFYAKLTTILSYFSNVRTTQIGHNTPRRPEIIDNFKTFKTIVFDKIEKLAREGPDKHATAFTP